MDHHYTSIASAFHHPRSSSSKPRSSSKPNSETPTIQIHDTPISSSLYCRRVCKRGASSNASKGRRDQGSRERADQNPGQHGRYDNSIHQGSRNQDICHGGPDGYSLNITHGYAVNQAGYYQQYHHPHGYHQEQFDPTSRNVSQSKGRLDYPELRHSPRVMEMRHQAVDRVNGYGCWPNTGSESNDLQQSNQYDSNHSSLSNTRNYEVPDGTWSDTDSGDVDWDSSPINSQNSVIDAVDGGRVHPLHPSLLCRLAEGDRTEDINYFSRQNVNTVSSQSTSIDGDQDEEALQQGFQQLREKLPTLSQLEKVGEMDIITEAMARIENLRRTIEEVSPPDSGLGDDSVEMDSFQFDLSPPRSS